MGDVEIANMKMCSAYRNCRFISRKSNTFSYETFCTKTLVETQAQGNSEMVFLLGIAYLAAPR